MRANNIASHGKTGQVTASTIASLGRIGGFIGEIIEAIRREVFRAISYVTMAKSLTSKVDKDD